MVKLVRSWACSYRFGIVRAASVGLEIQISESVTTIRAKIHTRQVKGNRNRI
jgi:hypothetical protein